MADSTVQIPATFDPEGLRRKYDEERQKRLRPGGSRQYIDVSGDFASFADDPYVTDPIEREPLIEEVDAVVVGGGISGLAAAVKLRDVGVANVRVIDKAGDFGGTWYWNRYPGIRCDVEAYIYVPMLEELGAMMSEKYAKGSEILAHCRALARHFGLYDKALFQTQVTELRWDDAEHRWIVKTDRKDAIRARYVVLGSGPLSRPKLPGIAGIKDFAGAMFHTSRWDYSYTGGHEEGELTGLSGKRVAIIGTGASGIQVAPHVADWCEHLYIFQRTPASVDVRANRPTDPDWVAGLRPGWQRERIRNFDAIMIGLPQAEDLVNDSWTDIWGKLTRWARDTTGSETADAGELMQMADYQKMEEIRARVDSIVQDPVTAESLKPYYNQFCKRPLYSDDYLPIFNRENVTLIDTQGRGVERFTAGSVVFDGTEYPVDCVILATGFTVGAPPYEAGGFEIVGRGGTTLREKWSDGVTSLHGIYSHGFPNLFVIGGIAQAAVTINFTHILCEQAEHVAAVIKSCFDEGVVAIEIRPEAEQRWAAVMAEKAVDRSDFEASCTPGYYNNEGLEDPGPTLFGRTYGGGPFEYVELCAAWRQDGMSRDAEMTHEQRS